MKKVLALFLVLTCMPGLIGCTISGSEPGFESNSESSTEPVSVAVYPAAIMVDGEIYLMEGEPMSEEVADSAIIGYTTSCTDTFPQKDGETNFNRELEMPYAKVKDGVAVFYNNEWYLGTPFSYENTTTFTGIIIDHTVESSVPVVCVKVLDEEIIPYEAVFFELPEGEEDWGLKTDEVVVITCSGGFTESEPHYGTLVSIRDTNTDVLLPLDGVTMEVTDYSNTNVTVRITNETDKDIQAGAEGGGYHVGDCSL